MSSHTALGTRAATGSARLTVRGLALVLLIAGAGCRMPDAMVPRLPGGVDTVHTIEAFDAAAVPEAPATPAGQAPLSLTVEACRAAALEGNLPFKAALLRPVIAETTITEAEARFDALVFGDAAVSHSDATYGSDRDNALRSTRASAAAGARKALETGGDVSLRLPITSTHTDGPGVAPDTTLSSGAELSVTQLLLRGAGRKSGTHAIRLARLEHTRSEALTKLEAIHVLAAADRTYWRLYAAREVAEVRRQELALAGAQLDRARRQVRAGSQPEVEILRAELGVAEREEAVILAENLVRVRGRELKRVMQMPGLDVESEAEILPTSQPNVTPTSPDPERLGALAVSNRMELLDLELQLLQQASTIDFERNQTLPLVSLGYTYAVSGPGDSLGESLEHAVRRHHDDHRLGLQVEVPLGNRAARSRLRRAILQRMITLADREDRKQQVHQEVRDAVDNLRALWKQVLSGRQRVAHAQRLLEAEERQFDLGLRTSTDVLETQARLAEAQASRIRSRTDYQVAQVDIAVASGMLLAADRIRWETPSVDTP